MLPHFGGARDACASNMLGESARQRSVVVGVPTAGARDEAAFGRTVGYFVSVVGVRSVGGGGRARSEAGECVGRRAGAAARVATARDALQWSVAHADAPLSRVAGAVGVARDASRPPIFQALCQLLSAGDFDAEAASTGSARDAADTASPPLPPPRRRNKETQLFL